MGMVGMSMKKTEEKAAWAKKLRIKSRVNIFRAVITSLSYLIEGSV